MKGIPVENVRNVVLVGHTGSGKTQLLDAILHKLGVNDRLGSTAAGSSIVDWTEEERDRKISIWAKPFRAEHTAPDGRKMGLTLIDTPGYADFVGQMVAATAVADAALVVVDASSGIQVGTNRVWRRCETLGLPRGIVITGLDKENVSFESTLGRIQEVWGKRCVPVELPTGDRHAIVDLLQAAQVPAELADQAEKTKSVLEEDAAEEDDQLLEKYLGGEHLTPEELTLGLRRAVLRGHLVPVFEVESLQDVGVKELLDEICRLFPSPLDRPGTDAAGNPVSVAPEAPLAGIVWRAVNDPFVGQLSFVRIYGGTLAGETEILNATKDQKERLGPLHIINGRKDEPVGEAHAGDIVALAKLKATSTNDSLSLLGKPVLLKPIEFPNPVMSLAVQPKSAQDEAKVGEGLKRITDEDPTIRFEQNPETKELIISGMGDIHLDTSVARMKKRNNVDVQLNTPKVAYREKITAAAEGHYRHKKQTGGRGQYGEVFIRLAPMPPGETEWFEDSLVGTNVPRNFVPAIQKGLHEGMARGVLAGAPVVDTRVTLYDGSSHEVDSSEIAFKIASARAFTEGMKKARPVLLEPIMTVKIMIPDQFFGDITGDLNHRRGRILGMGNEDGMQVVTAEIPQSEMFRYSSDLRSITRGQGSFESSYARYDIVPSNVAQKVIAEAQKDRKEDEE